jgi:hypothetical protein
VSTLTLLMLGTLRAQNAYDALALDDFTVFTYFLNRSTHFHDNLSLYLKRYTILPLLRS